MFLLTPEFVTFSANIPVSVFKTDTAVHEGVICLSASYYQKKAAELGDNDWASAYATHVTVSSVAATKRLLLTAKNHGALAFVSQDDNLYVPANSPKGTQRAIFQYQQYLYHMEDARQQTFDFEDCHEDEYPQELYNRAHENLESFVSQFEDEYDCNQSDNDQWQNIIETYMDNELSTWAPEAKKQDAPVVSTSEMNLPADVIQ